MTRVTKARLSILVFAAAALFLCVTPTSRLTAEALPQRLDDRTFWSLVSEFSEPNGFFRSDNLVSNETAFQHVIPTLLAQAAPVSAYLGVGPDQNFTYIAALKPRIAFIVDIRRQNMMLHLMYKALIEESPTRAEFLSRLFSRPVPAGVSASSSADVLLTAYHNEEPDPVALERNEADIYHVLVHDHGFTLSRPDLGAIDYVYRAFYQAGPDIRYSFGRGSGWQPFPSYRDLMVEHDLDGVQRSYVASEALYGVLRDLERRNLIVPIVGDFGGPKALRSVARFLDVHHATVSVFYTSNVEQYLFRDTAWQHFYDNVAAMPIDSHSTFIRAYFNNAGRPYRLPPPDPSNGSPSFPPQGYAPPIGPRSVTLLNPISLLLAAYSEGHVNTYYDVVELSR
ncbi:MAG TPA: hypothetical protein VFZ98_09420 [Vicinamibacterales bacterium]